MDLSLTRRTKNQTEASFILMESFVINGGNFKNDYNDRISASGPIKAEKPGAIIIFNAGVVENNNYYEKCGLFLRRILSWRWG